MVPTIDLSSHAHVEALRWACDQVQRNSNLARELMGPPPAYSTRTEREGIWKARETAVRVITHPSLAAPLVRNQLAARGVNVIKIGSAAPDFQGEKGAIAWVLDVESKFELGACLMPHVPRLILAILSADSPEAALEALRKVGR